MFASFMFIFVSGTTKISTYSIFDKLNLHNWDGDFLLADRIMMIHSIQLQRKINMIAHNSTVL